VTVLSTLNLIEIALQKAKEARLTLTGGNNVVNFPQTPKAWRSYFFLTLRQAIYSGCGEAVKILPNPFYSLSNIQLSKNPKEETIFPLQFSSLSQCL
jgi:hypothetical protein